MHIVQDEKLKKLPEKKNFLFLAIGLGIIGTIIGSFTIWNTLDEVLKP